MKTFIALIALSAVATAEPQFGFNPFYHAGGQGFLPYSSNVGFYPKTDVSYFPYGQNFQQQAYLPSYQHQVRSVATPIVPAAPQKMVTTYKANGAAMQEDTPDVKAAKTENFQTTAAAAQQLPWSPYQAKPFYYHPKQFQQQHLVKREADPQNFAHASFMGNKQQFPFHYQPYGAPWAQSAYNSYQPRYPMIYTNGHSAYYNPQQQQPFYQPYASQGYYPMMVSQPTATKTMPKHNVEKRDAEPHQQLVHAAPVSYNQPQQLPYTPYTSRAYQPQMYVPLSYKSPFLGTGFQQQLHSFQPYGHFSGGFQYGNFV